jgi:hypothetical protein
VAATRSSSALRVHHAVTGGGLALQQALEDLLERAGLHERRVLAGHDRGHRGEGVPPSYGGRPSTAVNSVAPSDHRSDGGPGPRRGRAPGAMYAASRAAGPVLVMLESPAEEAMPKSVSTTRPSPAEQDVAGLHVAVDDPLPVRGLERPEQRQAHLGRALRGQRAVGPHHVRAASAPRPAP